MKQKESHKLKIPFALGIVGIVVTLIWLYGGSPIPNGFYDGDSTAYQSFLQGLYPEIDIHPIAMECPFEAVIYHTIRDGEKDKAVAALEFATENKFGLGAHYAIEHLESSSPEIREATIQYLRTIAGKDYGESPEPWRAWWANPPRNVLGIQIGQHTLENASPLLFIFLWTVLVFSMYRGANRKELFGYGLLFSWLILFFVVTERFIGGSESCSFGGETIQYWQSRGIFLGLEDAKKGGFGLFALIGVGYIVFTFIAIMLVYSPIKIVKKAGQWIKRSRQ